MVARVTVTEPVVREREKEGDEDVKDDELWARATMATTMGKRRKKRGIAGDMALEERMAK